MGFSSVPRLPGWSFQQRILGGVLPPPHCPDKSGPAGSPMDTSRKDSALPPVTSKKSILFMHKDKNGPVVQRSHYSYNAFIKSYERDGTVKSFNCKAHKSLGMMRRGND